MGCSGCWAVRLPVVYIFSQCLSVRRLNSGCWSGFDLATGVEGAYLLYLFEEYLPYFLLLAFSEAWLSGGVLTVFVIYRPRWVGSFDDAHYIFHK